MKEVNEKEAQYRKMTETPVVKLILELSLPTTVSMLVTNLYNMVDTYFVSGISLSASGAVGIVFGLMAIIQAFGFMFGHGSGSIISRLLGARDTERARHFSANGFYLSLASGLFIMIMGLVLLTPLCRLLGSTDTILPYARTYAFYILLSAPAMTTSCVMNNILRYEGHASFAMVGLISGSIINMGGDALFVSGLSMGIAGAGLSTMISQYISFFILLRFFLRGKVQSSFAPRYINLNAKDIWNIVSTGFPSMLRQGMGSVSTMALNWLAAPYGDAAIAALSVVARIFNVLYSVALGIAQGFQPVSSFNYGAKKYPRVRKAFLFTLGLGTCIMLCFGVLGFIFDKELIAMFLQDAQAADIAVYTLRLQCVTLAFVPVCICGNMLFQSIGLAGRASFLSSLRSGLIFIPTLFLLTPFFHLKGIEWSQPVADVLSAAISLPFIWKILQQLNVSTDDKSSVQ